jgi:gas vesicle protein
MEVRKILLGKSKSEDLLDNLSKVLEINKSSAGQIVEEINKQIFSTLKSKMQAQSAYVTSLGNTQMNANTYPQSFKPINTSSTTQQPLPPVTESPHADLEKAGGFTIEVAGNPLPNIEKPKPQPVELPKTQQPLPPNPPVIETKNETTSQSFQPSNYYNFKNNQEIKTEVEDKQEDKKGEEIKKEIENKPENKEKEISSMEEKNHCTR